MPFPRRPAAPSPAGKAGKAWPHVLVPLVLAPLSLLACVASGWYLFTGETPLDVIEALRGSARVDMAMPPPIGPEKPATALLHPPAAETKAAEPAVKADAAPAPAKKAPAADRPVTGNEPPPPVSEPAIPPGGEPLAQPSFAHLASRTDLKPLGPAPLPDLLHASSSGPLPIVNGGKEPRTAYERPFSGDASLPRVAVVVVGLGLSKEATEAAIAKLPPDVSLSFSPYAGNLETWVKRARAAGHEVLLDLPLEPPNFPMRDSGPLAVLSHQSPTQAQQQLLAVLGKATGYVGLAGTLHSPVAATEEWVPLLRAIRGRGLLFVGDGLVGVAEKDVPASASVTLVADETPFRAAIDARLLRLQAAAQRDGGAVAYLSPRPVSFERLLAWSAALPQKGLVLAPVSALVRPPSS